MPLTVDERRLVTRACRSLAHILRKDSVSQSWANVKESQEREADKLMELSERFERGLPPVR